MENIMSRHIPRHERWSKLGPNEYRSGNTVVRYDKGAWWALVSYRQRNEAASEDAPPEWYEQIERIGPFKRPRNAMMAAEERVLLLSRQYGDNVRFEGGPAPI
jgi:hypothetical protein